MSELNYIFQDEYEEDFKDILFQNYCDKQDALDFHEMWSETQRELEAEQRVEDKRQECPHFKPFGEMALCENGGRHYTRGWRGAKFVKRQTNKAWRRMAKRDPENAPTKRRLTGWVW